jgi:hypothetical protein
MTVDLTFLTELETKQNAAFAKNGKYAQLLMTHDTIPTEPTASKADTIVTEDIRPTLPVLMDFAFRVDELQFPGGKKGWMIWLFSGEQVKTICYNCEDEAVYGLGWNQSDKT